MVYDFGLSSQMISNYPTQDVHGKQLSKEELREKMQLAKRLDNIDPNLEFNSELIRMYHKVGTLFGTTTFGY